MVIQCKVCRKQPHELEEYIEMGQAEGMSPEEFVSKEEGTYNRETGMFYCTDCYTKIGMPLGTA